MLVPPDAPAARPLPAMGRDAAPLRPEPLDPDLEARLRRQRAQQYGRMVRETLAAWHARQAARQAAEAEAKREQWEAQRARRLARLAAKQQQLEQLEGQEASTLCADTPRRPPDSSSGSALKEKCSNVQARQGAQHPGAKRRPSSAPEAQHSPRHAPAAAGQAKRPAQQAQRPQRPLFAKAPSRVRGAAAGAPAEAATRSAAASPPATAGVAEAADPAEGLLAALLAAEGGGDPFSIINLFVQEQLRMLLQQQHAPAAAPQEARAVAAAAPDAGWEASRCAEPSCEQQAVRSSSAQGDAQAPAPPPDGLAARQPFSGTAEAVSVPSSPKRLHRRSSSALLPLFDADAELGAIHSAPSAAWAPADQPGVPDAHAGTQPAGKAAPALLLLPEAGPGGAPRPAAHGAAPLGEQGQQGELGEPPQQEASSKQLYVQQWLQQSAAELQQADSRSQSAAAASSPSYSLDQDHEAASAAEPSAASSPLSSAAATVQPKPALAAAAAQDVWPPPAEVQAAVPHPPSPQAGAAALEPAGAVAAAAAPPSALSSGSRGASLVSSSQRPGAPLPPGSSSLPDGSTLSASVDHGAWAGALWGPKQLPAAAAEEGVAEPAIDPARSQGGSSNDGSVPEVLSFGQLQAVAGGEPAAAESSALAGALVSVSAGDGAEGSADDRGWADGTAVTPPAASPIPRGAAPAELSKRSQTGVAEQQQQQQQEEEGEADGSAEEGRSSGAYSSDFDSGVEISYGEQGSDSPRPLLHPAAADAAAAAASSPGSGVDFTGSQPGSPRVAAQAWAAGSPPGRAAPGQQAGQRPRSPHHAALDDRYPGSPPSSPGSALQRMAAPAGSHPLSPVSLAGSRCSRRASGEGGPASRPGSPSACAAEQAAAAAEGEASLQQEDTMVVHSPAGSSPSSASGSARDGRADERRGSPYALLRFGAGGKEEGVATCGTPGSPGAATAAGEGASSPPGTPIVVSPGDDGSCPGSARVEDDTVVQTEAHVRGYLGDVMAHFWAERAEGFCAGAAPPLDLDGYLAIERRRPPCGDPQHIFNKLLCDAANEALLSHYHQALGSYAGRLEPRLALLSRELLERNVVQRVLRWAGLGGGGAAGSGGAQADVSTLLAEDALEDERVLAQLAGALQAELAAEAGGAQEEAAQGPVELD